MKDRLLELLAALGMGQNAFERKIGWSAGDIIKLKYAPRADRLEGIIKAFPTVNIKWLITGEGEMFDIPAPKGSQSAETGEDTVAWLKARIEAQERLITALTEKTAE